MKRKAGTEFSSPNSAMRDIMNHARRTYTRASFELSSKNNCKVEPSQKPSEISVIDEMLGYSATGTAIKTNYLQ